MTASSQDVREIFSRLFDHRPFLQGEIINFKKEFEVREERGNREVEQLFKALEHTTEIKQVRFEKVVEASDANLPRTIADIEVALRMCEDTLTVEQKYKFIHDDSLKKKRQSRSIRLAEAKYENEEKRKKLKEKFSEKEKEMRIQFEQLETSIKSSS